MRFEPNLGQTADEVRYLARGTWYSLFLTDTDAVLILRKAAQPVSRRLEARLTPFSLQRPSVGMQFWPLQRPESSRDAGESALAPTSERVTKINGDRALVEALGAQEHNARPN